MKALVQGGEHTVHYISGRGPGSNVQARAVRVACRVACKGMHRHKAERRIDSRRTRIAVPRLKIAGVVADIEPVCHIERYLGTEIYPCELVSIFPELAFLIIIAPGHIVFHSVITAAERDIVGLGRLYVLEEIVVPVGVGIIDILVPTVPLVDDHPRPGRVLDLVVASGPELFHIGIRIMGIFRPVVIVHEQVVDIYGIITPRLVIGGGGRRRETELSAVAELRLAIRIVSCLGGDKDDTEGGTRTVDR